VSRPLIRPPRNRYRFRRAAWFFLRRSLYRLLEAENPSAQRPSLLRSAYPIHRYAAPVTREPARKALAERVVQFSLRSLPKSLQLNISLNEAMRAKRFHWGRAILENLPSSVLAEILGCLQDHAVTCPWFVRLQLSSGCDSVSVSLSPVPNLITDRPLTRPASSLSKGYACGWQASHQSPFTFFSPSAPADVISLVGCRKKMERNRNRKKQKNY